jgi:hypothetical protein
MSLLIPVPGVDPGPDYATHLNNSLSILDAHDHSLGSGVQITPSGLNINSDLSIASNNLTAIRSTRFTVQISPLALGSDIGCLYVSGQDLYYNDTAGRQVRMTNSGAVAGPDGSISNLNTPASASYNTGNQTIVFQSNVNTAANLDVGSVTIRKIVSSSAGITLSAPTSLGSSYTLTLPSTSGSVGDVLRNNGSGNLLTGSFRSPLTANNYSLATSVASNALAVSLKTASGSDASLTNPIDILFRNSALGTGTQNLRTVTGALSLVVPSGATLGTVSGSSCNLWVYALDNAGAVELAISRTLFDESLIISTTALTGSSNSYNVVYSTTSRSNVPFRLIGRLTVTEATAGTWAVLPSEVSLKLNQGSDISMQVNWAGGTITATGSPQVLPFDTVDYDTANGISGLGTTSFKYTAPIYGKYRFTVFVGLNGNGSRVILSLFKNGTEFARADSSAGWAYFAFPPVVGTVELSTGDYVDVRALSTGPSFTVNPLNEANRFAIEKII